MKSAKLSSSHYAAAWNYGDDAVVRPLDDINDLGRHYVESSDEDLLLDICRAFHPYLMKYLVMIRSGHVALYAGKINKDVEPFIRYFLPKGLPLNLVTASSAVRHLHLAFKNMTADEIYDVFVELLLQVVKKYDPTYTEKVKIVAGKIDEVFRNAKSFSISELNDHLELDSNRYIRLLCRRGFLTGIRGKGKNKNITEWQRTGLWPPPASFFESGAIGFAYYIQTWFWHVRPRPGRLSTAVGRRAEALVIVRRGLPQFI